MTRCSILSTVLDRLWASIGGNTFLLEPPFFMRSCQFLFIIFWCFTYNILAFVAIQKIVCIPIAALLLNVHSMMQEFIQHWNFIAWSTCMCSERINQFWTVWVVSFDASFLLLSLHYDVAVIHSWDIEDDMHVLINVDS